MNWMWHALLHHTKKADVHHNIFRSSGKTCQSHGIGLLYLGCVLVFLDWCGLRSWEGVDLSNGSLNDVISSSIACLNRRLVTVNLAPWVQLPSPFMNRLV
jgi:hypothetical protein